ncbi:hypothetical protein LCGC14_0412260 [marine sediment metagenome]|uniref:Uncharacterized protein n=1 Tax=marine sediment metagenome TaxID=412755 RepID=A0A0F9STK9_9ZZZZ
MAIHTIEVTSVSRRFVEVECPVDDEALAEKTAMDYVDGGCEEMDGVVQSCTHPAIVEYEHVGAKSGG